jgi:hypothetical protein
MPIFSPIANALLRNCEFWIPICARVIFIVHWVSEAAVGISASMRSSRAVWLRPGVFLCHPICRNTPACPGSHRVVAFHPHFAEGFIFGVEFHHISTEPIGHMRKFFRPNQPVNLFDTQFLRINNQRCQKARFNISGFPKLQRQRMIGFDFLCQVP